jgi:hypothetical protein
VAAWGISTREGRRRRAAGAETALPVWAVMVRSPNCGAYLTLPSLNCTHHDCALEAAALCDKDARCHSFSLKNSDGGAGRLHSQTFAGGKGCLRLNRDWSTWVKSGGPMDVGEVREHRQILSGGSEIHVSDTPDGPFLPLDTTYNQERCNNPSPWVMQVSCIDLGCMSCSYFTKLRVM